MKKWINAVITQHLTVIFYIVVILLLIPVVYKKKEIRWAWCWFQFVEIFWTCLVESWFSFESQIMVWPHQISFLEIFKSNESHWKYTKFQSNKSRLDLSFQSNGTNLHLARVQSNESIFYEGMTNVHQKIRVFDWQIYYCTHMGIPFPCCIFKHLQILQVVNDNIICHNCISTDYFVNRLTSICCHSLMSIWLLTPFHEDIWLC